MTNIQIERYPSVTFSLRTARQVIVACALALTGCQLDSVVKATDPDVIDPSFIRSVSGAEGVRIGTLGRFNANTTGGESMLLYGGLMADEFTTGDTFSQRNETDQRSLSPDNANITTAYRGLHLVRVGALQARAALREFPQPGGNAWRLAEMYFVEAYVINLLAEHFCNGQPLSTLENFLETPSARIPTDSLYLIAQAKLDSGLALLVPTLTTNDDNRVRNASLVLRARIALNQGNFALAATAAASVPTSFTWDQEHALTVRTPGAWALVNNQRRYIVSNNEGPLAMAFANAVQDPRVPTCAPGAAGFNAAACTAARFTTTRPFDSGNTAVPNSRYLLTWETDNRNVSLINGLQARLFEAEAQNSLGNFSGGAGSLSILNALRATPPAYVVPGRPIAAMAALTDPATAQADRELIFREKALWLFGTGHRFGDLRRLQRQYQLPQNAVWPNGTWQNNRVPGYSTDVTFPTPAAEANNRLIPQSTPGIPACIDRNP
jgi:starch-binding outer membrane protein, SusD/RagB family